MKIKKNWRYLYINCISVVNYFITKSSTVKKNLVKEIQRDFRTRLNFSLFKSGRSSLYAVFIELKNKGYTDVLVPFRLCNVVEIGATEAKLNVVFYKNDESFFREIKKERFKQNKTVLLLATYFNENIDQNNIISSFIEKFGEDAPVIFDECQSLFDFTLFKKYLYYKNKFLVISFNDKFIPGVMGGAIVSRENINYSKLKLGIKNEFLYLAFLIKSCFDFIRPLKPSKVKGEFSVCKGIRYDIQLNEISKASSVVALHFLKNKYKIYQHIKNNHSTLNNCYDQNNKDIKIFYLFSFKSTLSNKLLKGPYLCKENEDMNAAIKNTGGIFNINSYKYKLIQ